MLKRILVVLAAVVAALVPALPASAHAVLLRTDPGSGAIVQEAPASVTLTFNEPVELISRDIGVVAPTGAKVGGTPELTRDGTVLRIPLRAGLPKGTFLVTYRVISADSHPVAGGFSFSIGAPSATAPAASGGTSAAENPVVAVAMPLSRYVGYAGLALLVGSVLFLMVLWPARLSRRGPARLLALGAGLVALGALAEFYLEVPYSTGGSIGDVAYHDIVEVMNSRFGWAHLLRLILLAAAVPLLAIVGAERRNELGRVEKVVLGVLAVVGLGTWGYGGHPSTSPAPWATVLSDAVHLGAMAVWLGGLVMLICFLLPRGRPRELAAVLPVWSRWATIAVTVLAVAGIVQACLQLGTPAALVDTTYGRLVIVKVVAFALVLAVASYSRAAVRRYVLPAPAAVVPAGGASDDPDASPYEDEVWDEVYGDEAEPAATRPAAATGTPGDDDAPAARDGKAAGSSDVPAARAGDARTTGPAASTADAERRGGDTSEPAGRRGLRRIVLVEVAILAVVLGVTAVLVQTTPARSARTVASQQQNLPYSATLNNSLFSLQVQIDPARTGQNTLHAIAYHPSDGRPVKVLEWRVTASLPGGGIGPVTIPVKAITDNHAIGDVALPKAGKWKFSFTARVSEIDEATVTATVPIR
ncbi:MAG TPA: copper resistance protein CopC [Actinocatenispora sp.]